MAGRKTPKITGYGADSDIVVADPQNSPALAVDRQTKSRDSGTVTISPETASEKMRATGGKIAGQAADKARGFVAQGLERTADALSSVSKMVGDTANGIDERVGADYGDYARKAASALDKAATSLGQKNPDELIDDTRDFVRKSPGMALAGAAVVGFVLARLVKSGLDAGKDDRD